MYDVDEMQNGILKIPWFHTPASHFSRNVHDTMSNISDQKMETMALLCIFGGSFFANPSPEILTKYNIKETFSKGNIWGPFYIPKGEGLGGG